MCKITSGSSSPCSVRQDAEEGAEPVAMPRMCDKLSAEESPSSKGIHRP